MGKRAEKSGDYIFPFFAYLDKKSLEERKRKKGINKKINEGLKKIRTDLSL